MLGLCGSGASILLMVNELLRTHFADPDDCKGAALMIAVMLVIALLCLRGLRRRGLHPD
jgi:hypothetical protein